MPSSPTILSAYEQLLSELAEELGALARKDLCRTCTTIERVDGPLVRIAGHELVSWCSNDYLGLSQHPALAAAAAQAAAEWGVGARAARLLAGTSRWHTRLEERLAAWFGTEAALVYPSGYLANLGTIGALLSSRDAVVIDRLAHASLFDAARGSRATLRVFRHNDIEHLATLLARSHGGRRLIITEGLFSMDGDAAPLARLLEVARTHGALVYLDDAHGAFVLGPTGRGTPEAAGLSHQDAFLYMGTLGKALGCQGGFVVGPRTLIDFLRNRARTFIYTTALAIPVAAAAVAALELLDREPCHLERLRMRVASLQGRLERCSIGQGLPMAVRSHIVPLVVSETRRALALAQHLWEYGHWAPAIRPPTVPEGRARLRLSVTAGHTDTQIESLVVALERIWTSR